MEENQIEHYALDTQKFLEHYDNAGDSVCLNFVIQNFF